MLKMMDKKEKAAYVETIQRVAEAPEEVEIGPWYDRRISTTAEGTKAAERKWYMAHEYVRIGDHVLKLEKLGIDRTVYYDDEYADPLGGEDEDARKEMWEAYNLRHHTWAEDIEAAAKWESWEEDGVVRGWRTGDYAPFLFKDYDGTSFVVWSTIRYADGDFKRYPKEKRRYLTPEELDQLMDVYDQLKANYIKRLDAYWKRYGDKVHSYGYWANR